MTKEEYEALMGMKVSDNVFVEANAVYENTDIDKQKFCEMWKSVEGARRLCSYLVDVITAQRNKIDSQKNKMVSAASRLITYADDIRVNGTGDLEETERVAALLMGQKEYLLNKLQGGCTLTAIDKQYLIDIIGRQ